MTASQTPTMSQFASKDHMIEYLQRELAAAKAEAEELRKELADRPSIGMVQILKQTIKAEHDEAEALREALRAVEKNTRDKGGWVMTEVNLFVSEQLAARKGK